MPTRNRPIVASELRFRHSSEPAVGSNGELNASNKVDLIRQAAKLLEAASTSGVISEDEAQQQETLAKTHKELLQAAFQSDAAHKEVGELIAAELWIAANKQGFSRRLLVRQELNQGMIPMTRMRLKNQVATVASAPVQVQAQIARDFFLYPPEFYINGRPFVEQREIEQSADDVLEEKFSEGLQALMVQEDRTWKALCDATQNVDNPLTTISGTLTPTALVTLRNSVAAWDIPATSCLFATDIWNDIAGDAVNWARVIDPVAKNELLLTGQIGTLYGMSLITDAYRFAEHKVLNKGDIYVIGDPQMHGQYTDRGGVNSQPIDGSIEKVPGRGWWLTELMSMVVANARSVQIAIRI